MKRKKTLVIGLSVGAVALTTYFWRDLFPPAAAQSNEEGSLFTVRRDDLVISLTENGTLVAKESEKLTPKVRGQGKIVFLVPAGEKVKEGQVVCKFDVTETNKRLEDAEMQRLSHESSLNTARTNLEIQELDNISKADKAQVALRKAEMELERYRDGDAPQQLRKLEIALKDADYNLEKAKKRYNDSKMLFADDYIKQTELEEHKIGYEKTVVEQESAKLAITLFKQYEFTITKDTKESTFQEAKRALATETKRAKSQLAQKQVAVTQAEKRVKRIKQQIEKIKEDLSNMELKAPCPGVVIYGDPRHPWNRENIKIGGVVWRGQTLMTIPDLRVMLVKLDIHEADINKIKPELPVTISMDTYPGLVLKGKVTKVAQIAGTSNPWENQGAVKKFSVEVTIADQPKDLALKPGISAKAEIKIDQLKDVLFVPLQCVFLEGESHFCNVQTANGIERRKVEIGASNATYLEVQKGLEIGERVLLFNPNLDPGGEKGVKDAADAKPDGKSDASADESTADRGAGTGGANK